MYNTGIYYQVIIGRICPINIKKVSMKGCAVLITLFNYLLCPLLITTEITFNPFYSNRQGGNKPDKDATRNVFKNRIGPSTDKDTGSHFRFCIEGCF